MSVSIIVACDAEGVIGKENKLPWRVPEDLKHFRERTIGHAIVMGRKTYDSIPKRPLEGRMNCVISRTVFAQPKDPDVGPHYFGNLRGAISAIRGATQGEMTKYRYRDIFIIGGAQLYEHALKENLVDEIIMSKIPGSYKGDVYFPSLGSEWVVRETVYRTGFDLVTMVNKNKEDYANWLGG